MKCIECTRTLSAFVDERLSPAERSAMEDHFRSCPRCAKELAMLKVFLREARMLRRVEAPEYFMRNLHRRLDRSSELGTAVRAAAEWAGRLFSLRNAAIVLVLVTAVIVFNPFNQYLLRRLEGRFHLPKQYIGNVCRKMGVLPKEGGGTQPEARSIIPRGFTAATAEVMRRPASALVTDKRVPLVLHPSRRWKKAAPARLADEIGRIIRGNGGKVLEQPGPQSLLVEIPPQQFILIINELNELGILEKPLPRTPGGKKSFKIPINVQ